MRVVLADLKGAGGFVHKDTVVGGYGARLRPLSRVTSLAAALRRRLNDVPSITMGYLAAILARAGHEVAFTRDRVLGGHPPSSSLPSSTIAARRRGPIKRARRARASVSSASRRPSCRTCSSTIRTSSCTASPRRR